MTDDFISVGKIVSSHGLKGTLKIAHNGGILSESPKLKELIIFPAGKDSVRLKVQSIDSKANHALVRFEGYDSIEKVESLKGFIVYLDKKSFPKLSKEEFYTHQLIGLIPFEKDQEYSDFKISNVLENPAHPILVFTGPEKEILVPYVDRFVGKILLSEKKIEVFDWMDWFDEV